MRKKKYQFMGAMQKPVLLALLLLLSCMLHAQQQGVPDTTILAPAPDDESPVIPAEEMLADTTDIAIDQEDEDGKDKKNHYFDSRQMPGSNDSLFLRKSLDNGTAGKKDDDFWYANSIFLKKKKTERRNEEGNSLSDNGFFQAMLWMCIIGGFIAFLVIYLSNSSVGLFRSSKRINDADIDPETDDIFAIQFQQEIDKAINSGNYRLGVRLHFLRLLRSMADKNIIQYTKDRTNFDYLMQVQQAQWYHLFFRLTRNYEYVWYGQFDINREKFDVIRNEFANLEQQLPRG